MSKFIQFTVCFLTLYGYFLQPVNAQQESKAVMKGVVSTKDGQSAPFINIRINDTQLGDISNEKGEYTISNVPAGHWHVRVSAIGISMQELEVTVSEGEVLIQNFQIKETSVQLETVTVNGRRNSMTDKESDYISRMPLKNIENPQSYSIATKELLKEKNIIDYQSAVRSIPGVAVSTTDYQGSSVAFVRGFASNPYIRNGIYYMNLVAGDPQNLERLEAIKGPAGALYGSQGVSYGGLINRVTKKPFDRKASEIGLSIGGYGLTRVTADINSPLNKDSSLLFRVNAAATWQQSFQDYGSQKTFMLAPSFSYHINDKLDILMDMEFNSTKRTALTAYPVTSAIGYKRFDQVPLDYFKTYGTDKADYPPSITKNFYTQINYQFNSNWRLSTNIAYSDFNFNSGTIGLTFKGQDTLLRDIYDFYWQYNSLDIQPNVNGEFRIGRIRNKVLFGLDFRDINTVSTGYYPGPQDTISLSNPIHEFPVRKIRASKKYLDSYFEQEFKQKTYAVYASDVISFTERLNLLLSIRYDHYKDGGYQDRNAPGQSTGPDAGTFAPKFGATYQLIKNHLTLFANYMQGIKYVAPDMSGHVFSPERARQTEGGIKIELADGKLSSTISYYNIQVQDKVRTDPDNPNNSIQDGTQESKGIDADLIANPLPGLSLVLGYEYNSNKFQKSEMGMEGKRPYGTPPHSGNAWLSYTIQRGVAKGLGFGMGAVYSDGCFGTDNNQIIIPGYTVMSGTAFYSLPKVRFALGLDNLTNKHYWDVFGTPQMPRRLTASMIFKF